MPGKLFDNKEGIVCFAKQITAAFQNNGNIKKVYAIQKPGAFVIQVLLILGFCWVTPAKTQAQKKDFELWTKTKVEKDISKNLRLSFSDGVRLKNNIRTMNFYFFEPEIRYEFNDRFEFTSSYRFSRNYTDYRTYIPSHDFYFDLTTIFEKDDWELDLRVMIKTGLDGEFEDHTKYEYYLDQRNKISLSREIDDFPLDPFLNGEIFFPVQRAQAFYAEKIRFFGGVDISIAENHEFELQYGFEQEIYQHNPGSYFILGLEYTLEL